MTRLSARECTHPPDQPARERLAFGHEPENVDWLTTVQDLELGFRAAERLDFMEDKIDVRFWGTDAVTRAFLKGLDA